MEIALLLHLSQFDMGFLRVAGYGGGGGVPAADNSKTINDNAMKFGAPGSRESQTN